MRIKTPLALASTALLTVALGACAHSNQSGTSGMTGTTGTTGASGTTGTTGASGTTGTTGTSGTNASTRAPSSMAAGAGTDAGAPMAPPVAGSPAEALALVAAVDQHEITLAQQAKSKNVTGPVLEYANMMLAQHTPHLRTTRTMLDSSGGMPSNSAGLQKLMAMDQQTQKRLGALEGEAYARAYMEHMVMSHQLGVAMVDASMGVATEPALRDFMQKTRQAMQMHLEHARTTPGQLRG